MISALLSFSLAAVGQPWLPTVQERLDNELGTYLELRKYLPQTFDGTSAQLIQVRVIEASSFETRSFKQGDWAPSDHPFEVIRAVTSSGQGARLLLPTRGTPARLDRGPMPCGWGQPDRMLTVLAIPAENGRLAFREGRSNSQQTVVENTCPAKSGQEWAVQAIVPGLHIADNKLPVSTQLASVCLKALAEVKGHEAARIAQILVNYDFSEVTHFSGAERRKDAAEAEPHLAPLAEQLTGPNRALAMAWLASMTQTKDALARFWGSFREASLEADSWDAGLISVLNQLQANHQIGWWSGAEPKEYFASLNLLGDSNAVTLMAARATPRLPKESHGDVIALLESDRTWAADSMMSHLGVAFKRPDLKPHYRPGEHGLLVAENRDEVVAQWIQILRESAGD